MAGGGAGGSAAATCVAGSLTAYRKQRLRAGVCDRSGQGATLLEHVAQPTCGRAKLRRTIGGVLSGSELPARRTWADPCVMRLGHLLKVTARLRRFAPRSQSYDRRHGNRPGERHDQRTLRHTSVHGEISGEIKGARAGEGRSDVARRRRGILDALAQTEGLDAQELQHRLFRSPRERWPVILQRCATPAS